MIKALSPSEAREKKDSELPDFVVKVFNALIVANLDVHNNAHITKSTILAHLLNIAPGIKREEIFANNWLDVEKVYRDQGWKVTYIKTSHYSNTDDYFIFESSK